MTQYSFNNSLMNKMVLAMMLAGMMIVFGQTARAQNFELRGLAGKCLDARGPSSANGTVVQLWDCVNVQNQQWRMTPSGEIRGYGNKCLDVYNSNTANGTSVILWDCHGGANQKWYFTGTGELRGIGNKCLDVEGGNSGNGTVVFLWDCHGGANQKWRFTTPQVYIYEHFNFEGRRVTVGSDIPYVGNGWNDILSSLRVPPGFRVILYEHVNYQGRYKIITGNTSWVGDDFNDITSSIRIERIY